ncbi:helix-turn-helix domain-containing protein [Sphingomonas immobilis]|nr:hypothetical protein [Sphingomonas sp. CA1-15]
MIENWRVVMTALCNQFLTMHTTVAEKVDLGPTEMLIYLTVTVANVQRLMRQRAIPPEYCGGTTPLPREWVVPISRNAIASASRLPRETVRRHIGKMIARGLLVEDARGGVTPPPDIVHVDRYELMVEALMTDFARTTETMLRTGVISIRQE